MKKIISVILAVSLCAATAFVFSSCGNKESVKAAEEAFQNVNSDVEMDTDKLEEFTVANADKDSDNIIYNYNDENKQSGIIVNKAKNAAVSTEYVIEDALFKDVDNDGYEEVYVTGYDSLADATMINLFDYVKSLLPEFRGEDPVMEAVAELSVPGEKHFKFSEKSDGIHVLEGEKDYGVISTNGFILQLSGYNSSKEGGIASDSFADSGFLFFWNGEQFKPEKDFAYVDATDDFPIRAVKKETFEKITGLTCDSGSDNTDSRSIMVINGSEYVLIIMLDDLYNIEYAVNVNKQFKKDEEYFLNFYQPDKYELSDLLAKEKEEYALSSTAAE